MLEEFLANMTFSPVLIAIFAAIVIVCFWFGWIGRGLGVKRREKSLNRQIFEAKASVPQLETAARTGELKVARLEEQAKSLNDRSSELARDLDARERALKSAERRVRNLTSELEAVKGARSEGDNTIVDGFEEDSFSDEGAGNNDKLKKTQALYEKLKDALIERDEKIHDLESKLEIAQTSTGDSFDIEESESDTSQALQDQLDSQESMIESLNKQLVELHQERDMLADMAKRRSESNKSLKEASVAAEGQIPKLTEDIASRDKTITDREKSIKRFLNELEEVKKDQTDRDAEITSLSQQVNDHNLELTSRDEQIASLGEAVLEHEGRVADLVAEIGDLRSSIDDSEALLHEKDATITRHHASIAASSAQTEEHAQTTNTMQGAISDRDFKIETLSNELADAAETLRKTEKQANDAIEVFEKSKVQLAIENTTSQDTVETITRKADDLGARLAQSDRWLDGMKQQLQDREEQLQVLQGTIAEIQTHNDSLTAELYEQTQARQSAETDARANNRQMSSHEAKTKQAVSQLSEQNQTITVLKSTITELEFEVSSLTSKVTSLAEQLKTGAESTLQVVSAKSQ